VVSAATPSSGPLCVTKIKLLTISYLLLTITACGQTKNNSDTTRTLKVDTTQKLTQTRVQITHQPLTKAHPTAKLLMSDSFFFDVIEETAPFGSDDGQILQL
jgi:hypothetical protein